MERLKTGTAVVEREPIPGDMRKASPTRTLQPHTCWAFGDPGLGPGTGNSLKAWEAAASGFWLIFDCY